MLNKKESNISLVSVIVPVYNVETYLEECVNSIINQTYSEIEIILVDDGSTDSSGTICDLISQRDDRVRVVRKQNGGLSSARNAGIEIAKGDYFLFVDSDDIIANTMIEGLTTAANGMFKMVVSPITHDIRGLYSGERILKTIISPKDVLKSFLSEGRITTSASGKLYDARLWTDVRFPEGFIFEDFATIYKTVLKCDSICSIDACYYYYRPNPAGITGSPFNKKKMDYYRATEEIRKALIALRYDDLIASLNNRSVRYSISFFRDIARSRYYDDKNCSFVIKTIREHIFSYLFSKYKISSKLYGSLISISPKLARKVFENK